MIMSSEVMYLPRHVAPSTANCVHFRPKGISALWIPALTQKRPRTTKGKSENSKHHNQLVFHESSVPGYSARDMGPGLEGERMLRSEFDRAGGFF